MSDEKRLIKYLLENYERVGIVGRPVFNTSETVRVSYGLALIQILDLDEKNQVLTTNVWSRYVSTSFSYYNVWKLCVLWTYGKKCNELWLFIGYSCQNTHHMRCPIACPWGRDMWCLLCVQRTGVPYSPFIRMCEICVWSVYSSHFVATFVRILTRDVSQPRGRDMRCLLWIWIPIYVFRGLYSIVLYACFGQCYNVIVLYTVRYH